MQLRIQVDIVLESIGCNFVPHLGRLLALQPFVFCFECLDVSLEVVHNLFVFFLFPVLLALLNPLLRVAEAD